VTTFNKLWVSILGAILLGLAEFLPDGHLDFGEGAKLVNMVAAAVLVGHIANTAWNRFAKGVCQVVAGSVPVLLAQLADGWQLNADLWPTLIAGATAIGVIGVKNLNYPPLQAAPRQVAR
jgi:hypothetical protein